MTESNERMQGLLDLPVELRNQIYDYLLHVPLEARFRGVLLVNENYVKEHLPVRCYRGLLRTCRQLHREFKEAIRHMNAAKQVNYEFDITFSHGRPYFSLTWVRFPALSPTINSITIHVDLRLREPFSEASASVSVPHDHELVHLLEDAPGSFAHQLFDYMAVLLKTLASLMSQGDPKFGLLYTELVTLNLRWPTHMVADTVTARATLPSVILGTNVRPRRVKVEKQEAARLEETMRATLKANTKAFRAYDSEDCHKLTPLIQIGSLRFATEGVVWGEGHNLVLAQENFQWLRY